MIRSRNEVSLRWRCIDPHGLPKAKEMMIELATSVQLLRGGHRTQVYELGVSLFPTKEEYWEMRNLFFLLSVLIAVEVQAGVGAHGGNVVYCNNQPIVTLDYFNASLPSVVTSWNRWLQNSQQTTIQADTVTFWGFSFQNVFDEAAAKLLLSVKWIVTTWRM